MKKTPVQIIPLILLAIALPSHAQEAANPFVKKPDTNAPEQPPGASFASVLENVLVPPDLLDDWLREHPLKEDATELRAAVQGWVLEGKAKLDHTDLSHGVAGLVNTHESIIELNYPTEFEPAATGAWALPTAFDTRNLGQSFDAGICLDHGTPALWSQAEFCELTSSASYQELVDRTRQPDDMFLPRIRSVRISNEKANSKNPFHDRLTINLSEPHGQLFKPGIIQLAGRFDPLEASASEEKFSRLVFHRGEIANTPPDIAVKHGEVTRISFRTMFVSVPVFSSWIQNRSPLPATMEAWDVAEGWRKEGKARSMGELTTKVRLGAKSELENIEEFIYPTEYAPANETVVMAKWEEGKKINGKEGVATMERRNIQPAAGLASAALATAFDTRNLGTSIESILKSDASGLVLQCVWTRVRHLQDEVCHRIQVNGEWIPDATMPLFERNLIMTNVRLQPGRWTLLGAESQHLKNRKLDGDQCLLVFVKVE